MKATTKLLGLMAPCAFALVVPYASADQLSEIKGKGTLNCGVLGAYEPFGYVDSSSREAVGYDVDVCKEIGKKIGVKVEVKPVAVDARIPELQQGRIDLIVAGLGYSKQRAEQVSFSKIYFVSEHKLTVKSDRGYKTASDLAGKKISYTKGGITESFVKKSVPSVVVVGFEDTPTAFTALSQGKVDAFSVSEVVARRLVNKLGTNASKMQILEPPVGVEQWGIGVRNGETALLNEVNSTLQAMEESGEMQRLFDKWLGPKTIYQMKRSFKIEQIKE